MNWRIVGMSESSVDQYADMEDETNETYPMSDGISMRDQSLDGVPGYIVMEEFEETWAE